MGAEQRVTTLVEPICRRFDVELYDVVHAGGSLKVLVDRDGGVDLELLRDLTREVSRELDEVDPISGKYTLEVSSPGLERSLRRPEHYRGAVGTEVRIKTRPGTEGDRRVEGFVAAADDDGVTVTVGSPAGESRTLRYDEIEKARTVFRWGPTPKPGGGKGTRNRKATTA